MHETCSSSMFVFFSDVAFKDGKVGDYLFLGNMVYTVSEFFFAY